MHAHHSLLATIADRLLVRRAALVDAQMTQLRTFRSYNRVPDDDLLRSCERNVARVVATLEQRDSLPPGIEEDERDSGRRRALQAIPADDVVKAYRAVLRVLRDAFIEEASAVSADPWDVLAGTRKLWELTDRYSDVLVAARQQADIDSARREEQHRMALVQRLVSGAIEPGEILPGGAVHTVLPDREYWVVRAHADTADLPQLSHHLESAGPAARTLIAPFDNDVVAITAARPTACDSAVIAVGGPVRLTEIPQAFAEATRVLRVALRYHREGVVDSSSLSVRLAVEQHRELGEQLHRRYVDPVLTQPGAHEILTTIRTYFRTRRSIADTAAALSVHQNTVRYRLSRFETLVSASTADTDTLVEVWWALEHDSIRGDVDGSPSHVAF
ncbi:PucR family transcriptional regulator [Amycolatopsis ultiminotia]|uniref:PucR family transcriptional regulator n=1 Tax=Amycolatopsis ultiminotia TaxID=543629 RepID=A0ABP6UVR2_9PSEU